MSPRGVVPLPNPFVRSSRSPGALATIAVATLVASTLNAAPAPAASTCTSPPPVAPESQLTPGTVGHGLTTLSGQTPEPFDVTFLGVIPDGIITGLDLIVAQITGPATFLSRTGGIVSGMSGSPVYVGDRLAGSTSYAWYGDLTIIGITPAQAMVDLFQMPGADGSTARAAQSVALTPRMRRQISRITGASLDSLPSGLHQMSVPLGVSGLPDSKLAEFQRTLDEHHLPFVAYRAAAAPRPTSAALDAAPIAPGAPFASALSYGDYSVYAIGTATASCGNLTVAYGHPLFYYPPGPTQFGMNDASIITIVKDNSGLYGGFKLGVLGAPHGTITQDRFAGEVGLSGALPPTVRVTSDFSSPDTGRERVGETDIVWQQEEAVPDFSYYHAWLNLADVFQAIAAGTLEADWTVTGTRADGSTWRFSSGDMRYSNFDATEALYKMSYQLSQIARNRFENVAFTSVRIGGSITAQRLEGRIVRVRTASSLQPSLRSRAVLKVKRHGAITVEVTLAPVDGEGPNHVVTLTVRAPSSKGSSSVSLRGGRSRYAVSPRDAGSFDDLLAMLNDGETPNDLVVSGAGIHVVQPQDVIVDGRGSFSIQVV